MSCWLLILKCSSLQAFLERGIPSSPSKVVALMRKVRMTCIRALPCWNEDSLEEFVGQLQSVDNFIAAVEKL